MFVLVFGGLAAAAAIFVDIEIKKKDEGLQSGMGYYSPCCIDNRCSNFESGVGVARYVLTFLR